MSSNYSVNSTFTNLSTAINVKNTLSSDYIVGCLLLITSVVGLSAYLPCLWTMLTSSSLKQPCYIFMISLGFSDCMCLICWVLAAVYTCFHGSVIPDQLVNFAFVFMSFGWGSMKSHEAATAINRYIAVCHRAKHDTWYCKKRLTGWLIFCWTFAFVDIIPAFIPPGMAYTLNGYYVFFSNEYVITYLSYNDIAGCTVVFLISAFCYTSISMKFRKVRKQVVPKMAASGTDRQALKERHDMMFQFRLALQTSIRCFTFYIYDVLYFVVSLYNDDLWVIFVCGTYLWCLTNAMNGWIYLVFNQQLRHAIKRKFLKSTDNNVTQQKAIFVSTKL